MTVVITEGTAERHLRAERVTLSITPNVVADTAEKAVRAVESTVSALAERAAALRASGAATWHQVGAVTTYSRKVGQDDDRIEHIARAAVQIKLADLTLVGPLTSEFAPSSITVHPAWALTEATRKMHEREVRIAAVGAARARVEDYAAALGGKVKTVLEVSDLGGTGSSAQRGSGAASGPGADLTIPEITVSARVVAKFEVS